MELIIVIAVIVGLFTVAAFVPRFDRRQGDFILLADKKQAIKIIYRIWASWRVEPLHNEQNVLTQRFETFKGDAPYYQIKNFL